MTKASSKSLVTSSSEYSWKSSNISSSTKLYDSKRESSFENHLKKSENKFQRSRQTNLFYQKNCLKQTQANLSYKIDHRHENYLHSLYSKLKTQFEGDSLPDPAEFVPIIRYDGSGEENFEFHYFSPKSVDEFGYFWALKRLDTVDSDVLHDSMQIYMKIYGLYLKDKQNPQEQMELETEQQVHESLDAISDIENQEPNNKIDSIETVLESLIQTDEFLDISPKFIKQSESSLDLLARMALDDHGSQKVESDSVHQKEESNFKIPELMNPPIKPESFDSNYFPDIQNKESELGVPEVIPSIISEPEVSVSNYVPDMSNKESNLEVPELMNPPIKREPESFASNYIPDIANEESNLEVPEPMNPIMNEPESSAPKSASDESNNVSELDHLTEMVTNKPPIDHLDALNECSNSVVEESMEQVPDETVRTLSRTRGPRNSTKLAPKSSKSSKARQDRNINLKRVTCDICGHSFQHRGNLNAHRRIHLDIKPFYCKYKFMDGTTCTYSGRDSKRTIEHIRATHFQIPRRTPVKTISKDLDFKQYLGVDAELVKM